MGKKLRTEIYSLAYGGSGVGKVDGKVCFVEGALPGEDVLFDVLKDTPRYMQGRLSVMNRPSPDRVEPVCRYYGRCGGCQLQHLSYEKEVEYKKGQFVELIRRIAGIRDFDCGAMVASPRQYHYRTSITMHRTGRRYGYYDVGGSSVIEIDGCSLAAEPINERIAGLSCEEDGKDDITMKMDHTGKVWSSDKPGERFFLDRYRGFDIYFSPKGFSQCNRDIAEEMAVTLEEWIGPVDDDTVFFDAYCGVGFFSFLLNNSFDRRIGIDSNRVSIDCAKTTLKHIHAEGIKFYKSDAEKGFNDIFERNRGKKNILLMDPPRKGAAKEFIEYIKNLEGVTAIYYISCDPARLARDIKVFTEASPWKLARTRLFDMFPRTGHIEAIAEFLR